MSELQPLPLDELQFYTTPPYRCTYLPDRMARSRVATPVHFITPDVYSSLVQNGFRRSGIFTYQPRCDNCQDCVSVRVPVNTFQKNRSQKRAWEKHSNLRVHVTSLGYDPVHYALYHKYQTTRHPHSEMAYDNREQYAQFLLHSHSNTRMAAFYETPSWELKMVSVIDVLNNGLSSVYTFFDPSSPQNSYGVYSILWQIEQCRELDLPYLYLGYWIKGSRKMSYKANYRPLEGLLGRNGASWETLSPPLLDAKGS